MQISPYAIPGIQHNTTNSTEIILHKIIKRFSVTEKDLRGKNRTAHITFARHAMMYLMRTKTKIILPEIAGYFNRHHTTVMNAVVNMRNVLSNDRDFTEEKKILEQLVNE